LLSYRHSFHAGNFADLLKHIVQVEILEYLTQKDKPFEYIDTHAGSGLYNLSSDYAAKNKEFENGFAKLNQEEWSELETYFSIIQQSNEGKNQPHYPGSPKFAEHFLRPKDRSWLFELHTSDAQKLERLFANNRQVDVQKMDGFKGMLSRVPPISKRALIMIDPSYELKEDYDLVVDNIFKAYQKFANGIYALWYPVVDRGRIKRMEKRFVESGIRNIQLFELGIEEDTRFTGMTSAGMIVVNPPWTLFKKMSSLLPKLANELSVTDQPYYRCKTLVSE
jgi:23S rRNA (adenine2030-N6)-methyltransferase